MDHPALSHLFCATDHARVSRIAAAIGRTANETFKLPDQTMYDSACWKEWGEMGLFQLGIEDGAAGNLKDAARALAMTADALGADKFNEFDLAVYVQGIVAAQTLAHFEKNAAAASLLPKVRAGQAIICTLYTDNGPKLEAARGKGGYHLRGAKWLSINLPHARYAIVTADCEGDAMSAILDLRSEGIAVNTQTRIAGVGSYSQGEVTFSNAFLPDRNVLATGLQRLRVWNRVMSLSRLQNCCAAFRTLGTLQALVRENLQTRQVVNGTFYNQPAYQRWIHDAQATQTLGYHAVAAHLVLVANGRIDEAGIAGLKAILMRDTSRLTRRACALFGGQSTLLDSPVGRLDASINLHLYSSGAEAQLLALFTSVAQHRARWHDLVAA